MKADHFLLPDLRILPTSSLVLHEHADRKRVTRLHERLLHDGFLKNPPIVAPIPGIDRYVVLDGANRTSALCAIGSPHVLAQVVDYKGAGVQLYTWHHLITGRAPANFIAEIGKVPGIILRETSLEEARTALDTRAILAYIVVPSATASFRVYAIDGTPGTEHHSPEISTALLNATVDTYKNDPQVTIHRVNSDSLDELRDYYDNISGVVVFPPYTPDDILRLAVAGTKVPTGITRHIISPRALRINVPLSLLIGEQPLDDKIAWWHEQLKRKLSGNEIRLYQESTYLFDE